jgi:hypothetical protein
MESAMIEFVLIDTSKLPLIAQKGLQWSLNTVIGVVAFLPIYLTHRPEPPKAKPAFSNYIPADTLCVQKNHCLDLVQAMQKFEADTGVKVSFGERDGIYHPIPAVGAYTTSWFKQDIKRPQAWIQTYKAIYPNLLNSIDFFNDIDDREGDYTFSDGKIRSESNFGSFITLHEIGHAFTPLDTFDKQLAAFEYFWGPSLISLGLLSDNVTSVEGVREYVLNNTGENPKQLSFANIIALPLSQRVPTLKANNYSLHEISAVPMELFSKTFDGANKQALASLKLRQIVLLSNGHKAYLTDEFLRITYPIRNPEKDFDLAKYEQATANYFATVKNPVVSSKLKQYYKEAVELKLITPKL